MLEPSPDGGEIDHDPGRAGREPARVRAPLPPARRLVPGRLAAPVWVDDEDFDLSFHVRPAALPRPGTPDQLRELVAGSSPPPRPRPAAVGGPLVEGLEGGRVAVIEKAHLALVDGADTVDLARSCSTPTPRSPAPTAAGRRHPAWSPARPTSSSARSGRARRTPSSPSTTCAAWSPEPSASPSPSARSSAARSARASATWPATRCEADVRPPARRSRGRCPSRAGSPPCGSRSPTCRPCTRRTTTPSTTSSSPWSRAVCGPG